MIMSGPAAMYMKSFFKQLMEVVGQMEGMFPDDPDFKIFHTFLGLLQRTNPLSVLSTFREHVVLKYEEKIEARDEEFILGHTPVEYGNDIMDIVGKMKTYWKVLSVPSKDSLWQYLHVLTQLCKRYYENLA
jgi:hypothetical protein